MGLTTFPIWHRRVVGFNFVTRFYCFCFIVSLSLSSFVYICMYICISAIRPSFGKLVKQAKVLSQHEVLNGAHGNEIKLGRLEQFSCSFANLWRKYVVCLNHPDRLFHRIVRISFSESFQIAFQWPDHAPCHLRCRPGIRRPHLPPAARCRYLSLRQLLRLP